MDSGATPVIPCRIAAASALAVLALTACGGGDATGADDDPSAVASAPPPAIETLTTTDAPSETVVPTGDAADVGADARACPLLDEGEISTAIGHDVAFSEQDSAQTGLDGVCVYASPDQTVFVTVMAVSADFAAETIQELRDAATALSGSNADPIAVGDDGFAFGHDAGGEAATVVGDLLLDVQIMSTSGPGDDIGNQVDAAVSLLERLVTTTT